MLVGLYQVYAAVMKIQQLFVDSLNNIEIGWFVRKLYAIESGKGFERRRSDQIGFIAQFIWT